MTGGKVVVLGSTGRNFAAGMSGGIAYVLDEKGTFPPHCNKQMVDLEKVTEAKEEAELKALIQKHADLTGSKHAIAILENWTEKLPKFVKVMPRDYKRMLLAIERATDRGLSGEEALMAAFEDNAKDLARLGGG